MFRLLGSALSPNGGRARLAILIFHRVLPRPDPLLRDEIDAVNFERHMEFLKREFNVLPLREACERLARDNLPARAACITFDDGYSNNEEIALPILKGLGLPATFFIATGFLDGATMFNDSIIEAVRSARDGTHDLQDLGLPAVTLGDAAGRSRAVEMLIGHIKYRPSPDRDRTVERIAERIGGTLPSNVMMRPAQVKHLHDEGMEIGSHTVTHPIMAKLDDEAAAVELVASKRRLEEITGAGVSSFAYPNGRPGTDYRARDVRLVRETGYTLAVTTASGLAGKGSNPFQMPRFSPWDKSPVRLGMRLMLQCAQPVPRTEELPA